MVPSGGFPVAPFFRHAHGLAREPSLPRELASEVVSSKSPIHAGMEVVVGGQRFGRIVEVLIRGRVRYLHVARYALGHDELYLPTGMIEVIGRDFVSLHARPEDLAASIWHKPPSEEPREEDDPLGRAA